jgi:hypothetical protein
MLEGSLGAPGSSPDFSSSSFSYCTILKHEFALELVIVTNQNLSKLRTGNIFQVRFHDQQLLKFVHLQTFLMVVHKEDIIEEVLLIISVTT